MSIKGYQITGQQGRCRLDEGKGLPGEGGGVGSSYAHHFKSFKSSAGDAVTAG